MGIRFLIQALIMFVQDHIKNPGTIAKERKLLVQLRDLLTQLIEAIDGLTAAGRRRLTAASGSGQTSARVAAITGRWSRKVALRIKSGVGKSDSVNISGTEIGTVGELQSILGSDLTQRG